MTDKEVISILRERRKQKKMSIQDVAKIIDVHRNTLGRMEAGEVENLKYGILEKYATLVGYDLTLIHRINE